MRKKGISPLISTVLLIGFSVALAAVVMTWGLDYIRGSTEKVGEKTEEYLRCSDLAFEISAVDCSAGRVTVQNNGELDIANVTLRLYVGPDITIFNGGGIPAFANNHFVPPSLAGVSKVEAIASLKGSSGSPLVCKDTVKEFASGCP